MLRCEISIRLTAAMGHSLPMRLAPVSHDVRSTPKADMRLQPNICRDGRVEDGRGNLGHSATPRFPSPLIEPDVPISGIRLSDWFSSHGTQRCVEWSAFEAQEPAFPIDHITGEAFGPAPCHFVPSGEEIAHALIDVSVNTTEC